VGALRVALMYRMVLFCPYGDHGNETEAEIG
jgi:hypothetical protein